MLALELFSGQVNSGPLLTKFGLDPDLGANPIQKLTFTTGDTTPTGTTRPLATGGNGTTKTDC